MTLKNRYKIQENKHGGFRYVMIPRFLDQEFLVGVKEVSIERGLDIHGKEAVILKPVREVAS